MVAFKERFHPVSRQPILCIEPFRGMTFAAHLFGNLQRRTGLERFDLMFKMTICANRRLTAAAGGRPPVHAPLHVIRGLGMALTASRYQS